MLDLIIRGGDVVTPQGVTRCDVGVKGETIAAVTAAGALPDTNAQRIIDAAGKIVMPGGIDPHVHMAHPFMIPDGTILYTQGIDRVGQAALWGGTTTLIDFSYVTADKSVQAGQTYEYRVRARGFLGECIPHSRWSAPREVVVPQ